MTPITTIEDLRVLAKRRVPKALFDYVDGGSYDELTLRANRRRLRRRHACASACWSTPTKRDLSTTMLGEKVSMPVAIAPTGMTGLLHGDGEMLAARAAEKPRHQVLPLDHVDQHDRGSRRRGDKSRSGISSMCSRIAASRGR